MREYPPASSTRRTRVASAIGATASRTTWRSSRRRAFGITTTPSRRWSRASRAAQAQRAVMASSTPLTAQVVVAATLARAKLTRDRTAMAMVRTELSAIASSAQRFSGRRPMIDRPRDTPCSRSTGSPERARRRATSARTATRARVASSASARSRVSSRASSKPCAARPRSPACSAPGPAWTRRA
jgi:hypothetical protein